MAKNYYQILGLPKGAGGEEVSKAFKKLARKHHPDMNPGDKKAEEKFKELSEAYEVLSNPEKKKKYDTFGSADFEGFPEAGFPGAGFPGGGVPGGGQSYTYTYGPGGGARGGGKGFDFEDLGDIFGDIFSGGLGGLGKKKKGGFRPQGFRPEGFGRTPAGQRGKDLRFSLNLDFLEAIKGGEKKIRLPNGVAFNVKIPAGVQDGARIRLTGKGEPGLAGGEPGDLYIEPRVAPHPFFKRVGNDIELEVPLSLSEALTGGKIKIPTLEGSGELKIPAGAQSGQKLRLKGKGVVNMKTKETGDLFVILQIKVPESLDPKTKEELLKLLKNKQGDLRAHFWKK